MSGILSEGQKWPVVRAVNPATFMCRLSERQPPGALSRPVQGQLYLYLHYKFQFPKHAFSDCDTVKSGTWTHSDGMHALSSPLGLSDWLTSDTEGKYRRFFRLWRHDWSHKLHLSILFVSHPSMRYFYSRRRKEGIRTDQETSAVL